MTIEEAADKIYLPKWPQCIIYGPRITEEQALEIIRRTDSFFYGSEGNDNEFNKRAREITRSVGWFSSDDDYETQKKKDALFKEKWGRLEPQLEYLHNSWISCAYIHGPNGWCRPNGVIEYHHNIGKYPEVKEVYDDLENIAKNFPFVELWCTLMDGEEDYCNCSRISFHVKDGKVEILDEPIPLHTALQESKKAAQDSPYGDRSIYSVLFSGSEHALSLGQLQEWANKVFGGK